MSSPLKEEFRRFKKLFLNYGKVIIGGMLLSGIFLFLYSGIRANYLFITLLTAVVSTLSLSLLVLLLYVRFHENREDLTERTRADNEELRRLVLETIAGLPSTQNTLRKPTLLVAEHVLLSVFEWGHLIGKIFYYGLSMVKLESGFGKGHKEV